MNIYYILILFYILSCNPAEGRPGMSESIKESKKREVYICQYYTDKKTLKVNDTVKLEFDDAWLEKRWAYGSNYNNTLIIDGYQLIVHTANKLDENFTFTWRIGLHSDRYFRSCGYKCIMTDFDSLPGKIESWKIQQGRDLYDGAQHKIIGDFKLYRSTY